ncbi:MAG: diphthine synthase [Methanomicrobiaceae archaeon]|nr:diphthine synthase [Methanomicrobiaceae archaeon]
MLTFVGLGLFDEQDISLKGLECIRCADRVYLESYTSVLMGADVPALERLYGKPLITLGREDVEQNPEPILEQAKTGEVVFLTGGDPMVSTTHADLRIRAAREHVPTRIIHGASISSAVCGLTGLQNYRFGKSCSLPFPTRGWFPTTPLETIWQNQNQNLHTLVYLDIQEDRYMRVREGIEAIEGMAEASGLPAPPLYVGVARAGSPEPVVAAGDAETINHIDFGPPLHILVIPAELHVIEKEYLEMFAGL